MLAHAHAQYCSNKGAPDVDGRDFANIYEAGITAGYSQSPAHADHQLPA